MNEKNTLYIVVPCYKEQEVLPRRADACAKRCAS